MDKLPPIPTPAAQRWHKFRVHVLPMVMFAIVAVSVAFLWKDLVAPTGIVGEATHSDRVVGYLRQPIDSRPTTNDTVIVKTRTQNRQQAVGRILRVGTEMELINPALLSTDSNRVEVGLPILVSIPGGMKLVPGEFVDLSIKPAKP